MILWRVVVSLLTRLEFNLLNYVDRVHDAFFSDYHKWT